ncbi:hypothetical protein LY76DRAFT_592382, partial [Colletotrichum caudatum]
MDPWGPRGRHQDANKTNNTTDCLSSMNQTNNVAQPLYIALGVTRFNLKSNSVDDTNIRGYSSM